MALVWTAVAGFLALRRGSRPLSQATHVELLSGPAVDHGVSRLLA